MNRPLALAAAVAVVGAAGTLIAGRLTGMAGPEVLHLATLLLPALVLTLVAAVLARPLLARATFRQRLLAIVLAAVGAGLANLAVLALLMFVSPADAMLMASLLVYAAGAGAGVAVALSGPPEAAVEQLARTARELAEGNLDARAGRTGAGPELDALAETLDEMAGRLARSLAAERSAERKRRDLVTAVSHDLRTPLAGVRAIVEAIDDGVIEDRPTLLRYAAEMRRQIDTLVVLVDDLFELAQLDAGAIEAESVRARLEDVIHSAVKACRAQADEKGLVVEHRVDGAGKAQCSPRLIRVLQNLLQNAIRHTPADGTVRIEARHQNGRVEVAVEDTGEGIPADALDRVFEPFWRGDPARNTAGAGLGLALAKRIVEALGGDIQVRAAPRQGSRFTVVVPAGPGD